jgi:hypothetical protein
MLGYRRWPFVASTRWVGHVRVNVVLWHSAYSVHDIALCTILFSPRFPLPIARNGSIYVGLFSFLVLLRIAPSHHVILQREPRSHINWFCSSFCRELRVTRKRFVSSAVCIIYIYMCVSVPVLSADAVYVYVCVILTYDILYGHYKLRYYAIFSSAHAKIK